MDRHQNLSRKKKKGEKMWGAMQKEVGGGRGKEGEEEENRK